MTSDIQAKTKKSLGKFTRRQVMELDTCSHCALCTEMCPAYNESKNHLHAPGVRTSIVLKLYDKKHSFWTKLLGEKKITDEEIRKLTESTYHCSLCGRCMETCPFGFQTHELWIRIREIVDSMESTPVNVARLADLLEDNMNPYGLEPDTRLDWSFFTDLEDAPELDEAEIAYFVGCTTAYKGANHDTAFSICSILEELKQNWTLLGEDEWCCGAPSIMSGNEEETKKYAKHNIELLESKKVKKVLTGCAGCYSMLKFEYPVMLGRKPSFEILHAVQYLSELINSGKIVLNKSDQKIIYHDPCELGRLSGIIKEPREVISCLTSNLMEFEDYGIDSKCCGGGGLLQAVDNDMRLKIVKEKLEEAIAREADILVSACPACKLAFVDGVRDFQLDLEVRDIHELVAKSLGVLD